MVSGVSGAGSPQYNSGGSQSFSNFQGMVTDFFDFIKNGQYSAAFTLMIPMESALSTLMKEHVYNPNLKPIEQDLQQLSVLQEQLESATTPTQIANCEAAIKSLTAQMNTAVQKLPY